MNTAYICRRKDKNMNENYLRFNKLLAILSSRTKGGINISYKTESLLMKIIGVILFFNKNFMENYTTTIGNTIYFPSRDRVEKASDDENLVILSHEFVHIKDSERIGPLLFKIIYLSPQIFAPIFGLLFFILFNWYIGLIVFLVLLSPLPAYGRMRLEKRAYKTNLYSMTRILKQSSQSEGFIMGRQARSYVWISKQFISSAYYFCWPISLDSEFSDTMMNINSGEFTKTDDIYMELADAYDELYKQ